MKKLIPLLLTLTLFCTLFAPAAAAAGSDLPAQDRVVDIVTMHYANECMVALLADGTVKTSGLEDVLDRAEIDEIESWTDLVQVESCYTYFFGLKSDGSVVSTVRTSSYGLPLEDPFGPNHWTNVRQLITSESEYYAVTNDGRVLVDNDRDDPSTGGGGPYMSWTGVDRAIFYAYPETRGLFALRTDGTLLRAVDYYPFTEDPADIVDFDSSGYLYCGVRADGTVCVSGLNTTFSTIPEEADALRDVVQVGASERFFVCRLRDGSVKVCPDSEWASVVKTWPALREVQIISNVIVGLGRDGRVYTASNMDGRLANLRAEAESWRDIVRIKAYDGTGYEDPYILGWKYDGTVVAAGLDLSGLKLNQAPTVRYTDALVTPFGAVVALREDGTVACAGLPAAAARVVGRWRGITGICAEHEILYALRGDGRVEAVYFGEDAKVPKDEAAKLGQVSAWRDITAIVSTNQRPVGLKRDGSVAVGGPAWFGTEERADFSDWKGLVSLEAGDCLGGEYLIGLKADGVLDKGASLVGDWYGTPRRVVQTACSGYELLCLEQDGSVCSLGFPGVTSWRRIQQVCALDGLALGLGTDGDVSLDLTGYFPDEALEQIRGWRGIRRLCAGPFGLVVGITEDGRTLVAESDELADEYGRDCIEAIKGWTDLERIVGVDYDCHVLALRTDGTLVSFGLPLPD